MAKPTRAEIEQEELDKARAILNYHAQQKKVESAKVPPPLVNRVKGYEDKFIRPEHTFVLKTKSSNRSKQVLEFVRHVFHRYPVPTFMQYIWDEGENRPKWLNQSHTSHVNILLPEYEKWYICIATGGSLYKEFFKGKFTKKETHIFLNCKFDLTIPQALVFAVGKASGASDGNALRVAKSRLSDKVLTEFWQHVIRFFAAQDDLTIDKINDLIDYLHHKVQENANFTLAGMGYTVSSLTKKMHDWHYDLRRLKAIGEENWEGVFIPDSSYITKDNGETWRWRFHQIKSAKELQQEGNSMRHCVFSYKGNCIKGILSIWSLTCEDNWGNQKQRKVTIELSNDGQIRQARGIANRMPRPNENNVIRKWASDNNLKYGMF